MKIIKRIADSVVLYAGENLTLTATHATNGDWIDRGTTSANAALVLDVTLPVDWQGKQYTLNGNVWARTSEGEARRIIELNDLADSAILKIDADTDAIYGAVLGNRAEEYTSAADDAAAYKAVGYTGTVPAGVQSWATAKGWTAQQAADDILATRDAWVSAQNAIRAARLLRKEQVRGSADAAGIAAVLTSWAAFVTYMRGQLGL